MKSYDDYEADDWDAGDWADYMGGPDEADPDTSCDEHEMEEPPLPWNQQNIPERVLAWMANREIAELAVR